MHLKRVAGHLQAVHALRSEIEKQTEGETPRLAPSYARRGERGEILYFLSITTSHFNLRISLHSANIKYLADTLLHCMDLALAFRSHQILIIISQAT